MKFYTKKSTIYLINIFLILLIFSFSNAIGQVDDDKDTTSPKINKNDILIDNLPINNDEKPEKKVYITPNYLIKLSPFSIVRGEFPIHYERKLNKHLSFEVSPFATSPEIAALLFKRGGYYIPFNTDLNINKDMILKNKKFKVGYGMRLEFRAYPIQVFEKFYFGFAASAKKHFLSADIIEYGKPTISDQDFSYNETDYRFTLGFNSENLNANKKIFFEMALGIGHRKYYAKNYPVFSQTGFGKSLGYQDLSTSMIALFGNVKIGFTL